MGFTVFGLSDGIQHGVQQAGYTVPTPIQSLVIQPAMAGKDIIASAQTGTGKTAAFVLPILHRLEQEPVTDRNDHRPRALVLTPTRELAQQVQDAVATFGKFTRLKSYSIYGGVKMETQTKNLRRGADIIVATPGRLLDHLQRKNVDLRNVKILVLDEADRMLDMGFIRDVQKIIKETQRERQTMLFSATLSDDIAALAGNILRDPHSVEVGERRNPAESINQHFFEAPKDGKMDLLIRELGKEGMDSVLVFSRTKHGADKISRRLERSGIASVAIHSDRTQSQRDRALDGFKSGSFRVLVATDIAARGIDVNGISHVVNFDVPQYAEDYIHRIGRTGRAGATGDAITFVSYDEHQYLKRIERFIGKRFQVKPFDGPMPERQPSTDAPHGTRPARHEHTGERPRHGQRPGQRPPHKPRVVDNSSRPINPAGTANVGHPGSHVRTPGGPAAQSTGYPRKKGGPKPKGKTPHQFLTTVKKKKAVKKLDSYSTTTSWSNY